MKLYYTPRSRAGRVRWFLEELELPYELVRIDPKAERSAEHLAAHPLGAVPALEHEGVTLFELVNQWGVLPGQMTLQVPPAPPLVP